MDAEPDIGMFLKQNQKQNLKAESTSKFPSFQRFIMSPNAVLKSKPSYVDEKVKQAPSIFGSNKTMTCWDVKVKFTSFWSQEIHSLLRSEQLTQVMLGLKQKEPWDPGAFAKHWPLPKVASILPVGDSTEAAASYVVAL